MPADTPAPVPEWAVELIEALDPLDDCSYQEAYALIAAAFDAQAGKLIEEAARLAGLHSRRAEAEIRSMKPETLR